FLYKAVCVQDQKGLLHRLRLPILQDTAISVLVRSSLKMLAAPRVPQGPFREYSCTARRPSQPCIQEQMPPRSVPQSPQVKVESTVFCFQEPINLPMLRFPFFPRLKSSDPKLPSLRDFDKGVEALFQAQGPTKACDSLFPSPRPFPTVDILGGTESVTQLRSSWSPRDRPAQGLTSVYSTSRQVTADSFIQEVFASGHDKKMVHASCHDSDLCYNHSSDGYSAPQSLSTTGCFHSPFPDSKAQHSTQKYTVEEGDYIIYARHDKGMKWSDIGQEFAFYFGRIPERTVQGLQAWHYRINKYIPVWDQDGWLCFDSEDSLEPRVTSIKCRARDDRLKPMAVSGIAERYPERAVNYTWVDPETKLKSRDWAAKRTLQYEMRRLRRR
ncbi:hypothetical protein FSARC_13920, partial [Fusarium sarcochroum]